MISLPLAAAVLLWYWSAGRRPKALQEQEKP